MLLNKYDPRRKKHDELAKTFACGENIFNEVLEDLKPSKKQTLTRQSWVITGPRGAGKSHLITLLYREINQDKKLCKLWIPLIFPEEIFHVDSLYRLLAVILEGVFNNINEVEGTDDLQEKFSELKKIRLKGSLKEKSAERQRLAKEYLELLLLVRKRIKKKFIFMLENLQQIFREQLPENDQKLLRGFLNENPDAFIIIGTALAVFQDIEHYGKPFYHFFRVRSMEPLEKSGIIKFLQKVSEFRGDGNINDKIESNRHYIYTYNIFTGGNPRLILFLYELLLDNDELNTEIILEKVSELTPYFLDKTRGESPQRKLIIDALVSGAPAQTATEIAAYINEEQKSITEQLKRLAAEGWIKAIPLNANGVKQKEVFFTLRDYFYRIWYQVRTGSIDESEIYCMAELATLLFDKKEIEQRLQRHKSHADYKAVYERASELARDEAYMANINLLIESSEKSENEEIQKIYGDISKSAEKRNGEQLLQSAALLLHYPSEKRKAHFYSGLAYGILKKHHKSIECYRKAIEKKTDYHQAWYNMGLDCTALKDYQKAIECYKKVIEIKPDFYEAWGNMGFNHSALKDYHKAIECHHKSLEIRGDNHKVWHNMGFDYAALKNHQKAIECYKKAVEIQPDYHVTWLFIGASYAMLKDYHKAIEYYKKAFEIKPDNYEALLFMGISYDTLKDYQKSIECYKKVVKIKPDFYEALLFMGVNYAKLNDYEKAYFCHTEYIKYTPIFGLIGFSYYDIYINIAKNLFKSSRELSILLDEESSVEMKIESLTRLILLGKHLAVTDAFYELLQTKELPPVATKKLDFFLQGYIYHLFKNGKDNGELKAMLESWVRLTARIYAKEPEKAMHKFLELFHFSLKIAGKENVSLNVIHDLMDDLHNKGIEISGIALKILSAVKAPNSRNAQKWMADPLFKEIVTMLS